MTTASQASAEENTALHRSLTEVSDNVQKLVTRVNETGENVSSECDYFFWGGGLS